MSLINDALKKAQSLQARTPTTPAAFPRATPGSPALTPSPSGLVSRSPITATPAPTHTDKAKSSPTIVVMGIAGLVLLLGLGALSYVVYAVFFSATPDEDVAPPPEAIQPATPVAAPEASTAPATPPPAQAKSASPAPAAIATPAPAPTPPAPVATAPVKPAPAPTPAPAVAPEPVVEEVELPINNPSPVIQAWVDKISVAGIRAGARPKVLMNDRLYLIGDVVDIKLGVKLSKIGEKVLEFSDPEGNTYEYRF